MNCCGTKELTLDGLIGILNSAKEDRELLDDILRHYDYSNGEFKFISDKDFAKMLKRLTPENQARARHPKEILQEKIEKYLDKKYRNE